MILKKSVDFYNLYNNHYLQMENLNDELMIVDHIYTICDC